MVEHECYGVYTNEERFESKRNIPHNTTNTHNHSKHPNNNIHSKPSCVEVLPPPIPLSNNIIFCPLNASFLTAPYSEFMCEENVCEALDMNTYLPDGVSSSRDLQDACTDGIELSTRSDSTCKLVCDEGYSGDSSNLRCPANAQNGEAPVTNITCTMNKCAPISFLVGVTGDLGSIDACVSGAVLSTRDTNTTSSSCVAKCEEGYFGLSGSITCERDAEQDSVAVWNGQCIEVACNAYEFPPGVSGGGLVSPFSPPCTNGIQLYTHTTTTCNLQCKTGYSGSDSVLHCASNAMFGMDATTSISCDENLCQAYSWPVGVTSTSTDSETACNENTRLSTHTNPSCILSCESGFTGQAGTLTCPSNALYDQVPNVNISCVENSCESFSFDPSTVTTNSRSDACENPVILSTRTYSTCNCFLFLYFVLKILFTHVHSHINQLRYTELHIITWRHSHRSM